ncbi:MAG: acyl-CoA dehydrogenase [Spirochaetes bacterium]|nr:acyl-CoA dehydrogenase [Spirochaetota bacterium]
MANILVEKRDVDFVLYEQLNVDKLTKTKKFNHCSKDEFNMIIEQAIKFSENVLVPVNREGDENSPKWENGNVTLSPSIINALKEFADAGWLSMSDCLQSGGQGLPMVIFTASHEIFFAANMAVSTYSVLTHGAGKMIELFGTDNQKKRYMDKLYSFEWNGTMCLTEPNAGSDLFPITTKAVKIDERHYKIYGQKIFISGGEHNGKPNNIHMVLARIKGDPKDVKGISIFIVPKFRLKDDGSIGELNDVYCPGMEKKMGIKSLATTQLSFGDNDGCIGELLGEPRQGLKIMFNMMNEERFNMGIQGLGVSSTAYLHALNYSRQRLQGPDVNKKGTSTEQIPIIKHPDIRRNLLWMKSYVEGLRALTYYTATCLDMKNSETDEEIRKLYGGVVEFLTPVCKAYNSDWAYDICEQAIQIYGGYGYCRDYKVEQFARDSKIISIYEGTNGIQAMDLLGRKLTSQGGKIFKFLLGEIDKTIKEALKEEIHIRYAEIIKKARINIAKAAGHLEELLLEGKVHEAYLCATPFLDAVGDTLLGWMHFWQLMIAYKKLSEIYDEKKAKSKEDKLKVMRDNKDAAFYSGKIHSARFFITKVLPIQEAKIETIINNDIDALEIDDLSFGEEISR